jgi:hypothetical protein
MEPGTRRQESHVPLHVVAESSDTAIDDVYATLSSD